MRRVHKLTILHGGILSVRCGRQLSPEVEYTKQDEKVTCAACKKIAEGRHRKHFSYFPSKEAG